MRFLLLLFFSGPLLAQTLFLDNNPGILMSDLLFNTESPSWVIDTGQSYTCTGGSPGTILPGITVLNIDGHFYLTSGNATFFTGGLWFVNGDGVSNCRRSDGSLLPNQNLPTLVLSVDSINLSGNMTMLSRAYGVEWQIHSTVGDVICDGEIEDPGSSCQVLPDGTLFLDSFESCGG